jgi:hypothetical protein
MMVTLLVLAADFDLKYREAAISKDQSETSAQQSRYSRRRNSSHSKPITSPSPEALLGTFVVEDMPHGS